MACYRPLDGYRTESGDVKIGYEPRGSIEKLRIPCGGCFGCRMEYAEMWSIRCQHEAATWPRNLFLTLTYDEDSLPWHRSLELDHLQRFLKRLRRRFVGAARAPGGARPIRYFAAGEYGTQTARPHFHALLFNLELPDWSPSLRTRKSSEVLAELWPYGLHEVSEFTPARARYVAGYAAKKVRGRVAAERFYEVVHPDTGEVHVRRPEFCTMSKDPGIGSYFFQRYRSDFERGFVVERGGFRKRLPRFYRDKLLRDEAFAEADEARREEYLSQLDASEDSPERRKARELVHRARVGSRARERSF